MRPDAIARRKAQPCACISALTAHYFFSVKIEECILCIKAKSVDFLCRVLKINAFRLVGMTRFELATTRPPDEYSKPD